MMAYIFGLAAVLLAVPADAETRAIDYRRSLQSGKVFYETRTWRQRNDELQHVSTTTYAVTFDGDKIRTDRETTRFDRGPTPQLIFREYAALNSGELLRRTFDIPHPDRKLAALLDHLDSPDHAPGPSSSTIDPRNFGFAPSPFPVIYSNHLEAFVGCADRTNTTEETLTIDGNDVISVTYQKGSASHEMLIDPQRGYNLVSAAIITPTADYRIDCELKQYGGGELWYPSQVTYFVKKDDVIADKNITTVQAAEFNQPVDAEVFTFKGMGVEGGTDISETPQLGGPKIWDGKDITSLSALAVRERTATPIGPPQNRYLLIVTINGAIAVILLLVILCRRKKSKT